MPVYRVGQTVIFQSKLRVLKALAHDGGIYYMVGLLKKGTPLKHEKKPLWGVLNVDGSCEAIPSEVMKRAHKIAETFDFSILE